MIKSAVYLLTVAAISISFGACTPLSPTDDNHDRAAESSIILASHDSFSVSTEVIAQFEDETGTQVEFLALGDAGEALNKMILSKESPLADVFFGVDNSFLSRALGAGIFVPYRSPVLADIPADLQLDPEYRLLPVDFGYVNLNGDRNWFEAENVPIPTTLEELTRPEYAHALVIPNPATSSPGLAFLLATIAHFGEEGYLEFWQALRDNDVLVTDGWSDAYFGHFTVGSGGTGDRPLVVSYTTSPPADVLYASDGRSEPASLNLNLNDGVFRQIEFVGIVAGTAKRELAQQLVDFMLSRPFQEDMPLQMFVYPALPSASLPELFVRFAAAPTESVSFAPETIEANRERWIESWTATVLR